MCTIPKRLLFGSEDEDDELLKPIVVEPNGTVSSEIVYRRAVPQKVVCEEDEEEGDFSFGCNYDGNIKKWVFKNKYDTYFVEIEPSNPMFGCDEATKELIEKWLKPKYPSYKFCNFSTFMNSVIFDSETNTFSPPYLYTATVFFKYKKDD